MNLHSFTRAAVIALALLASSGRAAETPPSMREVSPGVFQIGELRIEKQQRTVTFPGKLNMADGTLEYLLVAPDSSTHEALLVTEIQPADLHLAMLLLGAKGAGLAAPAPEDAPPGQISKEYLQRAPKLKGDDIFISVKWKAEETAKTVAVEDWITNARTGKPAARGPWLYTGSMFREGKFAAQTEGTFAALVIYPSALINNPREHNDDDSAWEVNPKAVPAAGTPLEIVITLAEPKKSE